MARPISEEKRLTIFKAAAEIVAEQGLVAAPTSLIARRAGVAQGTLFHYFATKDVLLNELYIHLKQSMYEALSKSYVNTESFRTRFWLLWESYIDWGIKHPKDNNVVNQLAVSSILTPETHARTNTLFPDLEVVTKFAKSKVFDGREDFAEAIFTALADTTMEFAALEPENARAFKESGFATLWKIYEEN